MPLPLAVSCFSKIQIGFTFLVPAHPGGPGKRAVKRVCVSVCVSGVTSTEEPRRWETVSPSSQQSSADEHSSEVCKTITQLPV